MRIKAAEAAAAAAAAASNDFITAGWLLQNVLRESR
jgi:hypothetical protein